MKKLLLFLGGMVTGAILTFGILYLVAKGRTNTGMTFSETEGECMNAASFKIMPVIEPGGKALVYLYLRTEDSYPGNILNETSPERVLLLNDEGTLYL